MHKQLASYKQHAKKQASNKPQSKFNLLNILFLNGTIVFPSIDMPMCNKWPLPVCFWPFQFENSGRTLLCQAGASKMEIFFFKNDLDKKGTQTGNKGECLPSACPARYFCINYPNFSPRLTFP